MKTFLKFVGYTAMVGVGVVLVGCFVVIAVNWDRIEYQWDKYTFEPKVTYQGLDVNSTLSDVVFKLGAPDKEDEEDDAKSWNLNKEHTALRIKVKHGEIFRFFLHSSALPWKHSHPILTTEGLIDVMGEPDIYAVSKDFGVRKYVYLDYGISFGYVRDRLFSAEQGEIVWARVSHTGEYRVHGKQICPSENCPWDGEGELKPEWEGKSYRDL
ncbi:MAG: hypothetical protein ABJL54_16050 [Halioglobus sp.]